MVTILVDRREIRDTIALAVVGDDGVHKGHKEVLGVLGTAAGEVGAERVQNKEVFIWTVIQRLR